MDHSTLDPARRAELSGRPAALAGVLDTWLYTQHGVTSGSHGVGVFLDELAAAGMAVDWAGKAAPVPVTGSYGNMPPGAIGDLLAEVDDQGRVILEHTGGPLIAMSVGLFKQRDPEVVTVRHGRLIMSGVDRDGAPVELQFRAVGVQLAEVDRLAATEGGAILLELIER